MTGAHDDDHDHDHEGHEESASMASRVGALVAKLEAKGILSEVELDAAVEAFLLNTQRAGGPALVARAWVDAAFRARLLTDANAALDELGVDMTHWARSSCAPSKIPSACTTSSYVRSAPATPCRCSVRRRPGTRASPTARASCASRARCSRNLGSRSIRGLDVRVWDSTAELRYVVLPQRPEGTDGLGEAELAALVTRDALIGTAVCKTAGPGSFDAWPDGPALESPHDLQRTG